MVSVYFDFCRHSAICRFDVSDFEEKKEMIEDDKTQVIIALTIISIMAMWAFKADSINLINNIVSGLLGVAVGRNLK